LNLLASAASRKVESAAALPAAAPSQTAATATSGAGAALPRGVTAIPLRTYQADVGAEQGSRDNGCRGLSEAVCMRHPHNVFDVAGRAGVVINLLNGV
jgi:hypothetical protein